MTTTVLNKKTNEFEKKISDTSGLVNKTVLNTKTRKVESKTSDHDKSITTQERDRLTEKAFTARLAEVNLVNKTNFHNQLISFNRKITSGKTKYLKVL